MPCKTYDLSVEVRPWEFGSSPYSLREVPRVTRSIKFPDKGSERELSKSAGRSASELRCSLEMHKWSRRPSPTLGKIGTSILTETTVTDRWAPGVTGVACRGSHMIMNTGDLCRCLQRATGGYKETKFYRAHSTAVISKTT